MIILRDFLMVILIFGIIILTLFFSMIVTDIASRKWLAFKKIKPLMGGAVCLTAVLALFFKGVKDMDGILLGFAALSFFFTVLIIKDGIHDMKEDKKNQEGTQ